MGCDDSDGPGHAPRYLDVRPNMLIGHSVSINMLLKDVCIEDIRVQYLNTGINKRRGKTKK